MKPPALEIKLTLHRPGHGWEYTVRRLGEVIAASDGDACANLGQTLQVAVAEAQAVIQVIREEAETTNGGLDE